VPVICPTPQAKNSATHWHDGQISLRKRLKVKTWMRGLAPRMTVKVDRRHCEEPCDEAIQTSHRQDCWIASLPLAMTAY
jgi:hypothetical protein